MIPFLLTVGMLSYNILYISSQFTLRQPFDYLSRRTSREQYITKYRPEYPLIQYINKTIPDSSKILAVFFGKRGYYFDKSVQFDSLSGKHSLFGMARSSQSAEEITTLLRTMNVTHLAIRYDFFNNWVVRSLTMPEQKILSNFFTTQVIKISEKNNHGLFLIKSTEKI